MPARYLMALDDMGRWYLFDRADAKGDFPTWKDADAHRSKLIGGKDDGDSAPVWNPKSGGY